MQRYRYLNHTADLGIRFYGRTRAELFRNAAKAIFKTMLTIKQPHRFKRACYSLDLKGDSQAELLVAWLRELLYYFYTKQVVPQRYRIKFKEKRQLHALIEGIRLVSKKFRVKMEIKNVTYHNLNFRVTPNGFTATVIFDV